MITLPKLSNKFRWIAALVIFKIGLQFIFFVGLTNFDYGEESWYNEWADSDTTPAYSSLFDKFRDIKSMETFVGDASQIFPFRVAALYPNRIFVRMFGLSEHSLCLWTMLCGIGSMVLLVLIGDLIGHPLGGRIAGAVLAVMPGHIIYSSRLDTDIPQLFFITLLLWCTLKSLFYLDKIHPVRARVWSVLAGVSGGLAYLSKLTSGILGSIYVSAMILCQWKRPVRERAMVLLYFGCGLGLILTIENCCYYYLTGKWLLHVHALGGLASNLPTFRNSVQIIDLPGLRIWYAGIPWLFEYTRVAFGSKYSTGIYHLPLFGWTAWFGLILLPVLIPLMRRDRRTFQVLFAFFCYYLFLEFGSFWISTEEGRINLTSFHKNHRFIILCYPGVALAIGLALEQLLQYQSASRWKEIFVSSFALAIFALVSIGSVGPTVHLTRTFRNSLIDLRTAAHFMTGYVNGPTTVFVEPNLRNTYKALLGSQRFTVWQMYRGTPQEKICGGYVILGGLHGSGVSTPTKPEHIPDWLGAIWDESKSPPPDWQLEARYPSFTKNGEVKPIRIYKLPECQA